MAYDPRIIANLAIDHAKNVGVKLTNFSVNKVVFFLHGHYLARVNKPLVEENFEAWQHGPVSVSIYHSFKKYGDRPIDAFAKRMDFKQGRLVDIAVSVEKEDLEVINQYINIYTKASVSQLYDWSHVENGPWHRTWNYKTPSNPGMIISNREIENYFLNESQLHGGFRA